MQSNNNITPCKVSVLVPIYGVEQYIERCAISLFEQTYPNIEYIFVNDCTPDKSIDILQSVIKRYPNRKSQVQIIQHPHNKGLGAARNTAVAAATGAFLMHVDSDDYIDTTCIEKCIRKQQDSNADIVGFDYWYVRTNSQKHTNKKDYTDIQSFLCDILICKTSHCIWGNLIRTSLYKDHSISVEKEVNMSEDYQVLPRLTYFAKTYSVVHEPLYFYNMTNQSSYTSHFSIKNDKQGWKTSEVLFTFFNDKDIKYTECLKSCYFEKAVKSMVSSAIIEDYEYYLKMKVIVSQYGLKYESSLTTPYRIALLINSYKAMIIYSKFVHFCKSLFF